MSIRYTLGLDMDGKEVWKRTTADRDEVVRLAVEALAELEAAEKVAQMFLMSASQEAVDNMMPDSFSTASAYSRDLRSMLTLDVRVTTA